MYIYKVLFGTFRKYYGLCASDRVPLAKFQRLEIQDFGIPLLTQKYFWYLSTISHEQLIPESINNTICYKNSMISAMCT